MSHHRFHSLGTVPFSWENSPGISKVAPSADENRAAVDLLPLPPCTGDGRARRIAARRHSIHVPLPPCPFQPPPTTDVRCSFSRGDPFLAAYMECTKSSSSSSFVKNNEGKKSRLFVKRYSGGCGGIIGRLSCKQQGSGVREDGIVRVSQVAGFRERERLLERSKSHGFGV